MNYLFLAKGFEEIEALATVDVLRRAGMELTTVSIHEGRDVEGAHGVKVVADAIMSQVDASQAQWMILPGGMPGATNLAACNALSRMLVEHASGGGKVAAICASPSVVLAPLGILTGKNAVCYPGMEIQGYGVNWMNDMVVVDDNIVTGKGPAAACNFALTIVSISMGVDTASGIASGMLLG